MPGARQSFFPYRRPDPHVPDVEPRVDQEDVPGDDQAGEGRRDDVGVRQAEEEGGYEQLVRQGIQKAAHHGGLALEVSGNVAIELKRSGVGGCAEPGCAVRAGLSSLTRSVKPATPKSTIAHLNSPCVTKCAM